MTPPHLRRASAFVVALLLSLPAFAYRREYVITWEGQRKGGSEVCFYRGARGDAFSLFFTPGDVRCLPADAILDFPPGLIHVFARHKDGYASMQRDYVSFDGPPDPERGYQRLETPLVKAGIVDFTAALKKLAANQHLGLWISSGPLTVGTFLPIVPGEATIIAPAGITLVPLTLENGLPVVAGEPLYLEPGERQAAVFDSHPAGSDVIVWTHVDAESASQARSLLQPPDITLKAGDRTFRPVSPLYTVESGTFLIFRGVPRGKALLTLQGSMWKGVVREMAVLSQPVTIERDAVPLVAGGSVQVRWSTEGARVSVTDCPGARTDDVPLVRAALRHCTTQADGTEKCSIAAQMTSAYEANSSISFAGIPAGSYTVLVEPPYGKRQSLSTNVVVGRLSTLEVTFPSFNFFGTAKMNGKPVHARLIFDTGQAVTDGEGRYNARLAADPHDSPLHLEPCDATRTFTFIPHAAPAVNTPFDIDLKLSTLEVQVLDPGQHPVAGASVGFAPIRQVTAQGVEPYFHSPRKTTDGSGQVSFDDVPEGFPLSICARQPQYTTKCGSFDLAKLDGGPAVVQFEPAAMRGHVEGHTGQGYLTVVNPAGIAVEDVPLDTTGSFLFQRAHAAPEYLVYVSASRPLTVLPLPLVAPADLTIDVPHVPVRTFTVSVPAMQAQIGFIGIWVGGRYVPLQTFNTHMELRGLDSVLHRGRSVEIPDIAENGPIAVAFGVPDPAAKEFVDVFTLPEYAGVAQHRVKGSSVVLAR